MTPKEKAQNLIMMYWQLDLSLDQQKKSALIACDLHLLELSKMKLIFSDREIHYNFWKEVKKEIEKI